jgi:hypothetical protein
MLLMTACSGDGGGEVFFGGGGDSGGGTPTPIPVTTVSGTAAAGAPIKGTVHLRDATGTVLSQVIDDDGQFSIDINGLTAPYLLWADGTANAKDAFFYSMATEGGRANVTPATHCIMAMALGQNPVSYYRDNPTDAPPDAAKVDEAQAKLSTLFSQLYESTGVPAGFNLINTQFAADGTGFDGIMDVVEMNSDDQFVNIVDRGSNTALLKQELATGTVLAEETPEKVNKLCLASVDVLGAAELILTTLSSQFATARPTYDQLLAVMQPLMSGKFRDNGRGRDGMLTGMANGAPIGFSFENIALYRKMKSHTFGDVAPWSIDELPSGYAEGVWCTYTYRNGNEVAPAIAAFVRETADGPWKWHGDQNPFRTGGVVDAEAAYWRQPARLRIYSGLRFRTEDTNNSAFDKYGMIQFVVFNGALPTWYSSYSGNTYKGIVLSKDADPSVFYNITSTGQTWGGRYFEKDGLDVNAITDKEFVFVGFDSSNQSQHVWIDLLEKKPVKEAVLWKDAIDRASSGEFSSYFSELLSIWGEAPEVYIPEASMDSAAAPLQWELSPLGDHVDYTEVGFRDSANFRYVKGVSNPAFNDASLSLNDWFSTTIDISSLGLTGPPVSGWSYLQTRDEFLRRFGTETDFTVVDVLPGPIQLTGENIHYRTYSDPSKNEFRGYIDFSKGGLPIEAADIQEVRLLTSGGTPVTLGETPFDSNYYYFNNSASTPSDAAWEIIYYTESNVKFPVGTDLPAGIYYYEAVTKDGAVLRSADIDFLGAKDMPVVDAASMTSEWLSSGDLKLSWLLPAGDHTVLRIWIYGNEAGSKIILGMNAPLNAQEVTIPKRVIENIKLLNPPDSPNWQIQLRYSAPGNSNQSARGVSDRVPIDGWK